MAFNTLKADLVDYDDRGSVITAGDVTISSKPSKAEPVVADVSRVDEKQVYHNIKEDAVLQFGERYFTKLKKTSDKDSFGRPATTWKYKADEIGTYINTSQLIQSWTAKAPKGELYSAIGGSIVDKLGKDDEGYRFTAYCDGVDNEVANVYKGSADTKLYKVQHTRDDIIGTYFVKNSTAAAGSPVIQESANIGVSGNGVLTELYMNDDDNVTVVMINTYLVQATSDYNTSTERVSIEIKDIDESTADSNKGSAKAVPTNFLPAYIENDDFDVTGVKEDDYLLVTASNINWDDTTKKASIESVTPATVQTGTVTEYTDNDNVTVGGTKYSYNKILGENEKGEEFAINSDAALILDTYGYIMKVDDAITSSNFVYVAGAVMKSGLNNTVIANAYFTDGTNREITVTKFDGSRKASTIVKNMQDGWYVFSGGSNGEYIINTPNKSRYDNNGVTQHTKNSGTDKNDLVKSSNVKFMSSANVDNATAATVRADDKTIFVIKDYDDDVTAYTGIANVPSVTLKTGAPANNAGVHWLCKKNNGNYASYVFIDVSKIAKEYVDIDGGNTTADYMFVLKATGNKTHVDGHDYYKYTVVIDGKEEERWISDAIANTDKPKEDNGRLFYNVREDGNGYITSAKEVGKDGSNSTRYLARMDFFGEEKYKAAPYTVDGDTNNVGKGTYTIENDNHVINFVLASDGKNEITKNGSSVLNIPALAGIGKGEVIVNSKSTLNLVISSGADELLSKGGADYDAYLGTSVNNITSTLSGYNLAGRVYLITTDEDDSSTIDTLWIYVGDVKKQ